MKTVADGGAACGRKALVVKNPPRRAEQDRGQDPAMCKVRHPPDGGGPHSPGVTSVRPCRDTDLGG